MFGRDAVARAAKLVEETAERVAEHRRRAEQLDRLAAAAREERDTLASAVADEQLDHEAALRRREELDADEARHRSSAAQRRAVAAELDRRREEREDELLETRHADAVEAWAAALRDRNEARARFYNRPSAKALDAYETAAANADRLAAAVQELGELPEVPELDEPPPPREHKRVAAALAAGSKQPLRESAERLAKQQRDQAQGREQRIAWLARRALETPPSMHDEIGLWEGVEEPIRSEARERYKAELAAEPARREERARVQREHEEAELLAVNRELGHVR